MSRSHFQVSRLVVAATVFAVAVFTLSSGARPAAAQSTAIDIQQFRPNAHTLGGFAVDSPRVLKHLRWSAGLIVNYGVDPLRLTNDDSDTVWTLVSDQTTADLVLAVGFFDFLELDIDLPVTMHMTGEGLPPTGGGPGGPDVPQSGVGDLRITPRAQFLDGVFGLGLAVDIWATTGNDDAFLGDGNARVAPRVNMHLDLDYVMFLVNVGLRFVDDSKLFDLTAGHELFWGAGVVVPFQFNDDPERVHGLDLIAELTSYTALDDPYGSPNETGMEWRGGVRYRTPFGLSIHAAGGMGILPGYGTPDYRILAGIQYTPPKVTETKPLTCEEICERADECECCPRDPDKDRDRICDPWVAEEGRLAEFADKCKRSDECPDVPEDYDGWHDTDGCPEPDNDCDLVCDPWVENANIDQMAHYKQFEACPAERVTCPARATDDGAPCPVSTDRPQCRPSLDGGGVLHDVCPDRPETYNQNQDDDGCPDCTAFIPFEGKIEFRHAKWKMEDLTPESKQRLDGIVERLKSPKYDFIKKIRVEGHTSDVWLGKAWWGYDENIDLSHKRAQAVMQYLKEHGVAKELESRGYGWTRPPKPIPPSMQDLGRRDEVIKGDKKIEAWRDRSRRTVFRVVEWKERQEGCDNPCDACEKLRGEDETGLVLPPGEEKPGKR